MTKNKETTLSENFAQAKLPRRSSRLANCNEHKAWDVIIPQLGQSSKKL